MELAFEKFQVNLGYLPLTLLGNLQNNFFSQP
jgi:hypothetical protein